VTLAAFLTFASLMLLGAISPGPAVLMSARTGLTEGFRTGAMLAAGIGLGAVFWAAMALFGLGIVFAATPFLLKALKIGGGAFLVWIAWNLIRHAADPFATADARPVPRSPGSALRLGLYTQLSNPKPAVLMSVIFLGTVPQGTPAWQYAALFAVIFCFETSWNVLVARIFSLDRSRQIYIRLKPVIDCCFGLLLGLLGLKLALI
jgi:threonine/homoserine/homoserine lactone efflux protein